MHLLFSRSLYLKDIWSFNYKRNFEKLKKSVKKENCIPGLHFGVRHLQVLPLPTGSSTYSIVSPGRHRTRWYGHSGPHKVRHPYELVSHVHSLVQSDRMNFSPWAYVFPACLHRMSLLFAEQLKIIFNLSKKSMSYRISYICDTLLCILHICC